MVLTLSDKASFSAEVPSGHATGTLNMIVLVHRVFSFSNFWGLFAFGGVRSRSFGSTKDLPGNAI